MILPHSSNKYYCRFVRPKPLFITNSCHSMAKPLLRPMPTQKAQGFHAALAGGSKEICPGLDQRSSRHHYDKAQAYRCPTQGAAKTAQDLSLSLFLALFIILGSVALHQDIFGTMADQIIQTSGHHALITLKSSITCMIKDLPLIRSRSFSPRWINKTWGLGPCRSRNNKGSRLGHCMPLHPFHSISAQQLSPSWEPTADLLARCATPKNVAVATD